MKSVKVWSSLLFTSSLFAAQAEVVEFRDYDANTGTFTNAVRECTLVTSGTRTLTTGWWAVKDSVTIPDWNRLVVQEIAHLILCDGAKLSFACVDNGEAAVKTTDATLVIYGQEADSGLLETTGGIALKSSFRDLGGGTGIGGDSIEGDFSASSGGVIIINGGTVKATGETNAAGIGGGYGGAGTLRGMV